MMRSNVLRDVTWRAQSAVGLAVCVALLALATGCGPLGDDDDEDEPTPTGAASPAASAATPASSPGVATPRPRSSPTARAADEDDDGAPVSDPTRDLDADLTADDTPEGGDDEATSGVGDETPTPPVVEGCEEPEELPEVQGPADRATSAEADEGVNLRAGPGADCDLLSTLQPGAPIEVISGPVDAGEFLWVKVIAADAEGWMAEEFLEPVGDEGDEGGA